MSAVCDSLCSRDSDGRSRCRLRGVRHPVSIGSRQLTACAWYVGRVCRLVVVCVAGSEWLWCVSSSATFIAAASSGTDSAEKKRWTVGD